MTIILQSISSLSTKYFALILTLPDKVLQPRKLQSLFPSMETTNFVSQRQKSFVRLNSIGGMLLTQCDRFS